MTWLGGGKMKSRGVCLYGWRCARLGQSNQSRNGTSRGHSGTAAHPPDPDLGQGMGSSQSPVGLHPGCRMKRGSRECRRGLQPCFPHCRKGKEKVDEEAAKERCPRDFHICSISSLQSQHMDADGGCTALDFSL